MKLEDIKQRFINLRENLQKPGYEDDWYTFRDDMSYILERLESAEEVVRAAEIFEDRMSPEFKQALARFREVKGK